MGLPVAIFLLLILFHVAKRHLQRGATGRHLFVVDLVPCCNEDSVVSIVDEIFCSCTPDQGSPLFLPIHV